MPNKRQQRKKVKKGKARKGPGPLPLAFVPPMLNRRQVLVWNGQNIFNESGAGSGGAWWLRLNSVYDVDTNVGSTAVPGFAEMATIYANYKVLRTRVYANVSFTGASSSAVTTVVTVPKSSTNLPANPANWSVQYLAKSKTITSVANGGRNWAIMDETHDLAKIGCVTKEQFRTDFDFSSLCSGNPTRQLFVAIGAYTYNSGSVGTFVAIVRVSFEVEFFNPLSLSS